MYLEDEKIERYKAMSKPYKGEIRQLFRQRFEYHSDLKFETIINKSAVTTPLQYEYLTALIQKYHLFGQGVVQEDHA